MLTAGLLTQTLLNPIGAKYVYSDLNFITLGYIVGKIARVHALISSGELLPPCYMSGQPGPWRDQCYYEAFVRRYVIQRARMETSMFLPPPSLWGRCAPTWNDTQAGAPGGEAYRNKCARNSQLDFFCLPLSPHSVIDRVISKPCSLRMAPLSSLPCPC